ncbi:MAG: hypothetical protein F4103_11120 [Boseongicola sp. SB0673_bin_14]|nr:hypothetical protein [Boseongicola sp. SB0673_bin_14]
MIKYEVKKSDLSVEGYFESPAFDLFRGNSDVLNVVAAGLSALCPIRGADVRIDQETNPIGNANLSFELHPFNGFARISIDRSQIVLFSPHLLDTDQISRLSSSFFGAVIELLPPNSIGHYVVQFSFHAALEDISPAVHTRRFIAPASESSDALIGNAVTYYFGQHDPRLHSSITLDMSGEFSDCVLVRVAMGFDASMVSVAGLKDAVIEHGNSLLALVDLEAGW